MLGWGVLGETTGGGGALFFFLGVASGDLLHEELARTPFVPTAPGELEPAAFVGLGGGIHDVETFDTKPHGRWESDGA